MDPSKLFHILGAYHIQKVREQWEILEKHHKQNTAFFHA